MIPPNFEYFAPNTLGDAVSLLERYGEDAKILAGGQSLIPLMKLRLASPRFIVDLNQIQGLEYVRESDSYLRIGALTRVTDLEASEMVRKKYPVIYDVAAHIADPLVRNMGTVGGNIAHGDPANDLPAVMLALNAEFIAISPTGERTIKAEEFFIDSFTTALKPSEVLTEARVAMPPARSGGAYLKLEKRVGDFAIAGVATQLTVDGRGVCERVGIGLTSAGPTPLKPKKAEESLRGKKPDDSAIKRTADLAADNANPRSDLRGPAEYKREMFRVLTIRALRNALSRVSGGS